MAGVKRGGRAGECIALRRQRPQNQLKRASASGSRETHAICWIIGSECRVPDSRIPLPMMRIVPCDMILTSTIFHRLGVTDRHG